MEQGVVESKGLGAGLSLLKPSRKWGPSWLGMELHLVLGASPLPPHCR